MKRMVCILFVALLLVSAVGFSANPAAAEPVRAAAAEEGEGLKVALCNAYVGNPWRLELISVYNAYCKKLQADGVISEYYSTASGDDPTEQINQMRNLIAQQYDIIILISASPTALVPVTEEAVAQGIVVATCVDPVQSDLAYSVQLDDYLASQMAAEWLAEQIDYAGDVVMVRGIQGVTSEQQRYDGQMSVIEQYPEINVVKEIFGNWDDATVAVELNNALAALEGTDIKAVFNQAGGENTIYEVLQQYGLEDIPFTGEMCNGFYRRMAEYGVKGWGYTTPVYQVCYALNNAIAAKNGEDVEQAMILDVFSADYTQAEDFYDPELPDDFFIPWTDPGNTFGIDKEDVIQGMSELQGD